MANANKSIIQHGKRISLRCPVSITESSLILDKSTGKYGIKLALTNDGNSSLENDTAESALIVIRCIDSAGNGINFGDNEYIAKTVKFGENGLERSQAVGLIITPEIPEGTVIGDFEVYISRICFGDSSVTDYLRADFFDMPDKPVIIKKIYGAEAAQKAREELGSGSEYVPEALTDIVWRCTCGELCDDPDCRQCGRKKEDVFAYFGAMQQPAHPEKAEKKEFTFEPRTAVIAALSAVALVLIVALIAILASSVGKDPAGTANTDNTQTKPPVTSVDTSGDEAENLARAYAGRNDFDNALAVARNGGVRAEVINDILSAAVDYYTASGDYARAYVYASQSDDKEGANNLMRRAYDESMAAGDYDKASEYAEILGESGLKTDAVKAAVEKLISDGDYLSAYDRAVELGESALADETGKSGIEFYEGSHDYASAVKLATRMGDDQKATELGDSAVRYYLDSGDVASAAAFAASVGDNDLLGKLIEGLDSETLKKNLPAFFDYMSSEKKRDVLASRLSAGTYAAFITDSGGVLYGTRQVYVPDQGRKAVSVASSGRHTVVLHSDGRVSAFGDNSYGQCDVGSWTNIVMISVGRYHTVGLTDSGTVLAVGKNAYGECSVSSWSGAVSVSAGEYTTLALFRNGTVKAAGKNNNGQCNTGEWSDVVSISAGAIHSAALTKDGRVLTCGSALLGMSAVSSWSDVCYVSAGDSFTLGKNFDGDYLLTGSAISGSVGSLNDLSGAVYAVAGDTYILAMNSRGKLTATGSLAPDVKWINDYKAN